MEQGTYVLNSTKGKKERVGRLLQMHANHRKEIDVAYTGDIAAAVGFKDVTTGDTLCSEDQPIILEKMEFPDPVISVAVEPKTKADQEKMGIALQRLAEEDPTFRVHTDPESSQTIISGMGELHLEIIVDRMKREFHVECNVGKPQVAYRETIRKTVEAEGKFIRQTGGHGQYGHCWLRLSLSFASSPSTLILPLWQQFASLYIQPVTEQSRIVIFSPFLPHEKGDSPSYFYHFFRNDLTVLYYSLSLCLDRKSTRLNSSHVKRSRMPSSA